VRWLAVLAHARERVVLAGLVALVTAGGGARIWLLVAATGLPVTFVNVALVMLSLGVFGPLPLGPSASPAGTLATLGASGAAGSRIGARPRDRGERDLDVRRRRPRRRDGPRRPGPERAGAGLLACLAP